MTLSDNLKNFIEEHILMIEDNNFDVKKGLYQYAFQQGITPSELTQVLLQAGIDPLEHLDYIPAGYFGEWYRNSYYQIPDHIKSIGSHAFDNSSITKLFVPKSVVVFGDECFTGSHIQRLIYEGTRTEFFNIEDHGASYNTIEVQTNDSLFDYWGIW